MARKPRISPRIIREYLKLSTPNISDGLDKLELSGHPRGILPLYHPPKKIVGPAATMKLVPLHQSKESPVIGTLKAIVDAHPGDVLVIDFGGNDQVNAFGGVAGTTTKKHKLAGVVIDGVTRDIDEFRALGLPVYGKGYICSSIRNRCGFAGNEIEVQLGGFRVRPGDLICADDSGTVIVPKEHLEEVLHWAKVFKGVEDGIIKRVLKGEDPIRAHEQVRYDMMTKAEKAAGAAKSAKKPARRRALTAMAHEDIRVERVEDWVEVTIHRPEKLNSIRERTADEILQVLAEAEGDRAVGAVILQGSAKAFCTGIDTSEFTVGENEYFDFYRKRKRLRSVNRMFRELPQFSKPVITAVEGFALGGGLELALLGDMIVAGADAKLGLPELRLGLMPGGGGTQTLPRLVGKALAKELIWTGRRLSAAEAREFRLVNHVVEAGKALEKAREIARSICANAPIGVMMTKAAIERGLDMSLADGMAGEGDLSFMLYFSKDRQEGLSAFKEKRTPRFKGE